MKSRAVLVALLFVSLPLAGCIGGKDETEPTPATAGELPELQADKGAITGLLVDDRYRPIAGGLVLLQQAGLTARSNENGEFAFVDLAPGTYTMRVTADGHEASPQDIDVVAGEYAEARVVARRVMSEGGTIVTQEFTVFIPCAADFVVNGVVANCLLDLSGDSYRAGFTSNYTNMTNVTYLVTEMKANQVGRYTVQVREDNGAPAGGIRYAVARVVDTDYVKIINKFNETNTEHNQQQNNRPWDNDRPFATIMFFEGDYKEDVEAIGNTTCNRDVHGATCPSRGLGVAFGIKARFVQSLFIGEPEVDLATYRTLG